MFEDSSDDAYEYDGFVVSDNDPIEYVSDDEEADMEQSGNDLPSIPNEMLQSFLDASVSSEAICDTKFFRELVSHHLHRGFHTDGVRIESLLAFTTGPVFEKRFLDKPLKGTCDLCLLERTLTQICSNGKTHYTVGCTCGEHLAKVRHIFELLRQLQSKSRKKGEKKFLQFMSSIVSVT
jgi:hypothetical protein